MDTRFNGMPGLDPRTDWSEMETWDAITKTGLDKRMAAAIEKGNPALSGAYKGKYGDKWFNAFADTIGWGEGTTVKRGEDDPWLMGKIGKLPGNPTGGSMPDEEIYRQVMTSGSNHFQMTPGLGYFPHAGEALADPNSWAGLGVAFDPQGNPMPIGYSSKGGDNGFANKGGVVKALMAAVTAGAASGFGAGAGAVESVAGSALGSEFTNFAVPGWAGGGTGLSMTGTGAFAGSAATAGTMFGEASMFGGLMEALSDPNFSLVRSLGSLAKQGLGSLGGEGSLGTQISRTATAGGEEQIAQSALPLGGFTDAATSRTKSKSLLSGRGRLSTVLGG